MIDIFINKIFIINIFMIIIIIIIIEIFIIMIGMIFIGWWFWKIFVVFKYVIVMLEISLIFNIIYLINYIKFKFKYYKYKI